MLCEGKKIVVECCGEIKENISVTEIKKTADIGLVVFIFKVSLWVKAYKRSFTLQYPLPRSVV